MDLYRNQRYRRRKWINVSLILVLMCSILVSPMSNKPVQASEMITSLNATQVGNAVELTFSYIKYAENETPTFTMIKNEAEPKTILPELISQEDFNDGNVTWSTETFTFTDNDIVLGETYKYEIAPLNWVGQEVTITTVNDQVDNSTPQDTGTVTDTDTAQTDQTNPTNPTPEDPATPVDPNTDSTTNPSNDTTTTEEVVTIEDINLQQVIKGTLNSTRNEIYKSDLENLTSLSMEEKEIESLQGLEYATNLTSISLDSNEITDLTPLKNLTKLKSLHLYNNNISDLSALANLTNLTYLNLYTNKITDLTPLKDLTKLEILYLGNNNISDISPLAKLTNLKTLSLDWNNITNNTQNISAIEGLTNLTNLDLGANNFSEIDFLSKLVKLEELGLYYNDIVDVTPLAQLKNLQLLFLMGNQIENVDSLTNLTKIRYLVLDENKITDIPYFNFEAEYAHIDMYINPLDLNEGSATLENINQMSNEGMLVLYSLPSEQNNSLQLKIDQTSTDSDSVSVSWTPNNIRPESYNIYLNGELVDNVSSEITKYDFSNLPVDRVNTISINALDYEEYILSSSFIKVSQKEKVLVQFEDENLKNAIKNQLQLDRDEIYNTDLEGLTYLDANELNISSLEGLQYATNLINLNLNKNSISDISPLSNLTKLNSLELDINQISDISVIGNLKNLSYLYITNNQISDIKPLEQLTNLNTAIIFGNPLDKTFKDTVQVLKSNRPEMYINYLSDMYTFDQKVTENSIEVNWALFNEDVQKKVASYLINFNGQLQELDGSITSFKMTELTPETDYSIEIEAYNSEGKLLAAGVFDFKTNPKPSGEVVKFADENLKRVIQNQLGISREVWTSDMLGLNYLNAWSENIKDLTGLEHATNLQSLSLGSNEIFNLEPISKLENLTYLYIGWNQLDSVESLTGLTKLKTLSIEGNNLTDISSLKDLANLESLSFSYNEVSDISVLETLPNLEYVSLNANPINMPNNIINTLIKNGVSIEFGELYFNIRATEDRLRLNLEYIEKDISKYKVYLDDQFQNEVDGSVTTYDITELEPDTSYKVRLEAYDQEGNIIGLTDYYTHTMVEPTGSIISIPDSNLKKAIQEELGLERDIQESDMNYLTSLYAWDKGITSLEGLENAKQLVSLMIGYNSITDIKPLASLSNLQYIDLDRNQLKNIEALGNLEQLYSLDLRGNLIEDISILNNLPELSWVVLDDNPLNEEGFTVIQNLKDKGIEVQYRFGNLEMYSWRTTESSIPLFWYFWQEDEESPNNQNQDKVTKFKLYVDGELNEEFGQSTTEYLIEDLSPATSYKIRLEAYDSEGKLIGRTEGEFMTSDVPSGEPMVFADGNLEKGIQKALRLNRTIYPSDLVDLWDFNLSNLNISDLTGFEKIDELSYLELSNNKITDITPLSELTSLYYLSLWNNDIEDISVLSKLTSLSYLDLDENNIKDISPLKDLTNLETLWLSGNEITDISPLANLTNLREVYLYDLKLDLSEGGANIQTIRTLQENGTNVYFDSNLIPTLYLSAGDSTSESIGISWWLEGNAVPDTYRIYVDDTLVKTITNNGTYNDTIQDLDSNTSYVIKVEAVKGTQVIAEQEVTAKTEREEAQLKNVKLQLITAEETIPSRSLEYSIEGKDEANKDIFLYGYMNTDGILSTWYSADGTLQLPEGKYEVIIYSNGIYQTTIQELEIRSDKDYVNNPLKITVDEISAETVDYKIKVVDEQGNIIPNIDYVSLYSPNISSSFDYSSGSHYLSGLSDSGEITLSDVVYSNDYQISVSAKGYIAYNETGVVISEDELTHSKMITLGKGKAIKGEVQDESGDPLVASYYITGTNTYKYGDTDSGIFEISGLNPEDLRVEISLTGYETVVKEIKSSDFTNDTIDLGTIKLIAEKYISGYVTQENGDPAKDVYVYLYSEESKYASHWARTDSKGYFKIRNVAEGNYTLKTESYKYPNVEYSDIKPQPEEYSISLVEEGQGSFTGEGNTFAASKKTVVPGKTLDYRLDFKNNGTTEAKNVEIYLDLPDEIALVPESLLLNGETVTLTEDQTLILDKVKAGEAGVLTFQANVSETANQMFVASAQIFTEDEEITLPASTNVLFVTMTAPEVTAKSAIKVYGNAKPGSTVRIYDGDIMLAETNVTSRWWYSDVTLPVKSDTKSTHELVAKVIQDNQSHYSEPVKVEYQPNVPQLTDVTINAGWNKNVKLNPLTGVATMAITEKTPIDVNLVFDKEIENGKIYFLGESYSLNKDGSNYTAEVPSGWSSYGEQMLEIGFDLNGQEVKIPLLEVIVLIDPSGYVFEGSMDNRLEGVTAVVEQKEGQLWKQWDAKKYGQINPQVTDEEGKYGWDVIQGDWRVIFSKTGYETYISRTVTVPPAETQLNVPLVRATNPAVKVITPNDSSKDVALDSVVSVEFDRLMNETDIQNNIKVMKEDGTVVKGVFKLQGLNGYKESPGKNGYFEADPTKKLSQIFVWTPENGLDANTTYQIVVGSGIKDYADKELGNEIHYSFTTIADEQGNSGSDDEDDSTSPVENEAGNNQDNTTPPVQQEEGKNEESTTPPSDNDNATKEKTNLVTYTNKDLLELESEVLDVQLSIGKKDSLELSAEQVAILKSQKSKIQLANEEVSLLIDPTIIPSGLENVTINVQKFKDIKEALSPVYDFTISQGDKLITKFTKPVEITFLVDKNKVKDPKNVKVYYYNEEKKVWELVGGEYKDGKITAETMHFSTFTVFESSNIATTEPKELPSTATNTYNLLLMGLVLLILGSSLYLIKRKKGA